MDKPCDRIWSTTHAHRCILVNYLLTIKGESVDLIKGDRRDRRDRATEDARGLPSFWLFKLKHEYETEARITRDYQNYRHLFITVKCRSTGVDWQQTLSDFDVTSTMLNSIANAMYIF
ncbi:hypothetical protein NP493_1029g02044 [Ridgeia piscesae]|uniref:Uncharacterized protein n=1 Tax=Ridgeia piscesae TaxID=27915 RepID=A0AAD9NIP4_RIDPI|nr:hypothetical protein NP493_1029g02044 [Ridgeia piscesae]